MAYFERGAQITGDCGDAPCEELDRDRVEDGQCELAQAVPEDQVDLLVRVGPERYTQQVSSDARLDSVCIYSTNEKNNELSYRNIIRERQKYYLVANRSGKSKTLDMPMSASCEVVESGQSKKLYSTALSPVVRKSISSSSSTVYRAVLTPADENVCSLALDWKWRVSRASAACADNC